MATSKRTINNKRKNNEASSRNRIVAAILAILLGGLGIHKFYLGKAGWGILYFIFSWTFIPAILGLFEGIIFLTMSDNEFQEKYS
ncbi:MAG TPA: TM2 domain-containing protein [Patescibacteria group bacterium]|nr:TM2 domain-containing protein [Patescibacteria group bacterium]